MRVHFQINDKNNNDNNDLSEFADLPRSIVHDSLDVDSFINLIFGDLENNFRNMHYVIGNIYL